MFSTVYLTVLSRMTSWSLHRTNLVPIYVVYAVCTMSQAPSPGGYLKVDLRTFPNRVIGCLKQALMERKTFQTVRQTSSNFWLLSLIGYTCQPYHFIWTFRFLMCSKRRRRRNNMSSIQRPRCLQLALLYVWNCSFTLYYAVF